MCKHVKYSKKLTLPFLGIFGLVLIEEIRNFYFFPLIFTFGFFILYLNFPSLTYYTNTQPVYYEDLFIDKKKLPNYNVPLQIKQKFECIFNWTLIITSSLLMGVLSDYWLYKTNKVNSYLEILGITGGILKVFQLINNFIGKLLIVIIKRKLKKEKDKYNEQITNTRRRSNEIIKSDFKTIELHTLHKSNSSGNLPRRSSI